MFRRRSLVPVNRRKHIVDINQSLAANTQLDLNLIRAVDSPVLANVKDVATASKVNAIYLKLECQSNQAQSQGAVPNFYMAIFKNPGGNLTPPNPSSAGDDDNKKFIIHQEMVMFENVGFGGNPRVVFQGVIKIPKGYKRFGYNDLLQCIIIAPSLITVSCLQCIFQEYR